MTLSDRPALSRRGRVFGRLLLLWRTHARMSQLELATRIGDVPAAPLVHRDGPRPPRVGGCAADRRGAWAATSRPEPATGGRRACAALPGGALDAASVAPFRSAIRQLLEAHEPFPAFVLDRWWDVVDANQAGQRLFPRVGESYPNVVEAFLAPGGLREIVVNFPEVASMYLRRLEAEVAEDPTTGSRRLSAARGSCWRTCRSSKPTTPVTW